MPHVFFVLALAYVLMPAVSFAEPEPDPAESSEPDYTQYELTIFTAKPGKVAALHDWC